ncbi:MAG: hypothetical protein IPI54_10945 [Chitinophagaceae bacterium]|nr:hypothetical protein [Chitinophagaceae bacterium]
MKTIMYKLRASYLVFAAGLILMTSCNKDLEQFAPIATPVYPTGNGIAATLAANANYSNYAALIARAGMTATLNDLTKSYTIFATDNFGMNVFVNAASGGAVPIPAPSSVILGFINTSLPVASAAGIVQYNTIGQKFPFSSFGSAFPNYPITSLIILDPNQPFVRMPIFPDGGTPFSYVNNVPIIATDKAAANGIIHTSYTIAAPPTATLKTMIAAEPTLSYFRAAVARADSGSVGLSRFDSLMNYGVTNMTVLAPNDVAFQTLVFGLVYAQVFAATGNAALALASANGAVAAGPAFLSTNNVSTALMRGIVAYHLLASLTTSTTTPYQPNIRVFSNNVPAGTPTFIKTLVNGSIAAHPGVSAQATYTGPAVTSLVFRGYGTFPPGGAPYSGTPANAVTRDKHAVNGVYHILDNVLLPQ